jgi:hypothetical protein
MPRDGAIIFRDLVGIDGIAANKNYAAYEIRRDMWPSSPCAISTQGILHISDDRD